MLIDSHCHLDFSDYDPDRDEVVARALDAGVTKMITIGIDAATSRAAVDLAARYEPVFATVGHHPHEADKMTPADLDALSGLAAEPKVVAFGEIGLDFFKLHSEADVQKRRFRELVDLGLSLGLPLVIHDRDAHEQIFEALSEAGAQKGVIHCFSGDWPLARRFLGLGFHISIPGTVTFPKADLVRDVAANTPLDRLLLETDAPFLAPAPKRGRRNEPALVLHTAKEIARLRRMDLEELARATTENAERLFGLA
jgi:TatD DNase family protein